MFIALLCLRLSPPSLLALPTLCSGAAGRQCLCTVRGGVGVCLGSSQGSYPSHLCEEHIQAPKSFPYSLLSYAHFMGAVSYRMFSPSEGRLPLFRLSWTPFAVFISCPLYWQAEGLLAWRKLACPASEPSSGPSPQPLSWLTVT